MKKIMDRLDQRVACLNRKISNERITIIQGTKKADYQSNLLIYLYADDGI